MMIFLNQFLRILRISMYIDVQSVKHNPAAETVRVGWVVTLDAAVGVGDGKVIYGHIICVGDLIPIPSMMQF